MSEDQNTDIVPSEQHIMKVWEPAEGSGDVWRVTMYAVGVKIEGYIPDADLGNLALQADDLGTAARWALADLLAEGERRYGDTYSAIIKRTGKNYYTLANMANIARSVPFEVRRFDVDFWHYAVIAPLPTEQQKYFIDNAATKDQNRDDLTADVRTWQVANNALPEKVKQHLDRKAKKAEEAKKTGKGIPPVTSSIVKFRDYSTLNAELFGENNEFSGEKYEYNGKIGGLFKELWDWVRDGLLTLSTEVNVSIRVKRKDLFK